MDPFDASQLHRQTTNGLGDGNGDSDTSDVYVLNEEEEAEGEEEECEPGMKCNSKKLYAGREDKKGRFHWQTTIPKDVGSAVESYKTAKWALLVRYVKVYGDPRKVLEIHSIVIQSPVLKKLLRQVLKGYPGVTVELKRLEFAGKMEPLIHRWPQLQDAVSKIDPK
ncbi:hypothetical protein LTS18_005308, partial [Coniosporium uncinatum]